MNEKFDELTKGLAQSVTRRAALKKFGAGLAGMALACFGLTNEAHAGNHTPAIKCGPGPGGCPRGYICVNGHCVRYNPPV